MVVKVLNLFSNIKSFNSNSLKYEITTLETLAFKMGKGIIWTCSSRILEALSSNGPFEVIQLNSYMMPDSNYFILSKGLASLGMNTPSLTGKSLHSGAL